MAIVRRLHHALKIDDSFPQTYAWYSTVSMPIISKQIHPTHRLCDELYEKIRCTEIVDWTVEKSLDFFLVQVHCQNMTKTYIVETKHYEI